MAPLGFEPRPEGLKDLYANHYATEPSSYYLLFFVLSAYQLCYDPADCRYTIAFLFGFASNVCN
jgi:hypothetical protein